MDEEMPTLSAASKARVKFLLWKSKHNFVNAKNTAQSYSVFYDMNYLYTTTSAVIDIMTSYLVLCIQFSEWNLLWHVAV